MSLFTGIANPPSRANEPVKGYTPGSPERASLEAELSRQANEVLEIPCVVGGERILTGNTQDVVMPCDHGHVLARVHLADDATIERAAQNCVSAQAEWTAMGWEDRVNVFLRAAELLAGPWRDRLNASTMLGQGKTCHQAEIDAACELIDFWRMNAGYAAQIYSEQPPLSGPAVWNRSDHRPLEGFVLAISPFNFTSIDLNLPTAPAMMGNTAIWKPARTAALSNWYGYLLLEEAGLPPGVINFVNARGSVLGAQLLPHRDLAGVHFTGSTGVFQSMWRTIGESIDGYRSYPRIVGETGGKDFIVAHPSANADALAVAMLRGGFEYQGQKCSAASRCYVPKSLWPALSDRLTAEMAQMKQGDVRDFSNFVAAVIDANAFRDHSAYQALGRDTAKVLAGGQSNDSIGYFVEPTLVQVDDPKHRLMSEEIFGPILTVYVYDDAKWSETLDLVDSTSPYALTGAVFANERTAIVEAANRLRNAAGNFYINDKPTGAVVGQQPFGGARASGTNDKAGSALNLLRWVSPRSIKENFNPPTDWRYPFLG